MRKKGMPDPIWVTDAVVKAIEPSYIILVPCRDKNISYMIYPDHFPGLRLTKGEIVKIRLEYGNVTAIERRRDSAVKGVLAIKTNP
ncbi:MAG TPA: hypothetical protein DCE00_05705 [Firmicutes bacterium]|jgi:hypothetical protein|nr:hypothetical protein [Bacillota bacterium]HAA38349.1 hypothetical protein [Bacillota bacterium]